MRLKKILLPVDFSESGAGTARYAKALATHFHSELTLLHVFELQNLVFGGGEISMPPDWFEGRRSESQRSLDAAYAEEFANIPVRRKLVDGDVALNIVEYAHSGHMDLIVMPTHGYGRFRRFILGSVTAKVLHDADCPVLTGVHLQEAASLEPTFSNIVCAIDFDSAGEKALRWSAAFAGEFGSRLTVVHALPEIEGGRPGYFDPALPAMLKQVAQERMEELQAIVGTAAEVILEPGSVAEVVSRAGNSQMADLIVVGRHKNLGVLGRLRANAYAIVRESPCPVVSV